LRKIFKATSIIILILVGVYFGFGYINSYFGWYSHEHWKYRKGSTDIEESKKRGVFVKELNFKIEGYSGSLNGFRPFLEKAFTWGYHSSEETVPWTNTQYPYRLMFNYRPTQEITVLVRDEDLVKFDSTSGPWGFMKEPKLSDTIILTIGGENIPRNSAFIKVW
jgi:hypothetical protein